MILEFRHLGSLQRFIQDNTEALSGIYIHTLQGYPLYVGTANRPGRAIQRRNLSHQRHCLNGRGTLFRWSTTPDVAWPEWYFKSSGASQLFIPGIEDLTADLKLEIQGYYKLAFAPREIIVISNPLAGESRQIERLLQLGLRRWYLQRFGEPREKQFTSDSEVQDQFRIAGTRSHFMGKTENVEPLRISGVRHTGLFSEDLRELLDQAVALQMAADRKD